MLREITVLCYERLQSYVTRDYITVLREISIWITHTCRLYLLSVYIDGGLLFSRHTTPPSIFTLRDFVAAFAGLFLRRLCDLHSFYTLRYNIIRDYSPMLREITLQCYERLHYSVTRDYSLILWVISIWITHTCRLYLLSVYIDGGLLFSRHTTPPSIFTLRDFVAGRSILTALFFHDSLFFSFSI